VRLAPEDSQILGWRNGERFRLRRWTGGVPKYQNSKPNEEKDLQGSEDKIGNRGATASGGRKLAKR